MHYVLKLGGQERNLVSKHLAYTDVLSNVIHTRPTREKTVRKAGSSILIKKVARLFLLYCLQIYMYIFYLNRGYGSVWKTSASLQWPWRTIQMKKWLVFSCFYDQKALWDVFLLLCIHEKPSTMLVINAFKLLMHYLNVILQNITETIFQSTFSFEKKNWNGSSS